MRLGVNWYLNFFCNYTCSYCYARDIFKEHWGQLEFNSQEVALILDCIKNSTNPLDITLLGGEPTKDLNFIKIINTLGAINNGTKTVVSTNASFSMDFIKKINPSKNITFSFSFHPEQCDTQEFIAKAITLRDLGFEVLPQILLHPNKKFWEKIEIALKNLKSNSFQVSVDFLKDYKKKYSTDFWEWSKKLISTEEQFKGTEGISDFYTLSKNKQNSFKGWNCWNNVFVITPKGHITQSCSGKDFGNIIDSPQFFSSQKEIKPQICPTEICPCKEWLNFKKEKLS